MLQEQAGHQIVSARDQEVLLFIRGCPDFA